MGIIHTFTVKQTGIGKPDYSRYVSSAIERAGIYLKYEQQARMFAKNWTFADPVAYPLIPAHPLAAGASEHLDDTDTFTALPVTFPAGYALTLIAAGFDTTEDLVVQTYFDNILSMNMGAGGGGMATYANKLWILDSRLYDPTAAHSHIVDIIAYNRGGGDLYGGVMLWGIVEKVGSLDWPTTKVCTCPFCLHQQTVSVEESRITCDNCGKVYLVTTLSSLKNKRVRLP